MEYLRPVRLVLQGDRDKAHAHVRDARRLIASLRARSAGVMSNRDVRELSDGTIIEVIIAGLDTTAIITAPGGTQKTRWFEDFVVDPSLTAGSDDAADPIILKYAPRTPNTWIPYFWHRDSPGYGAAPSPKGTYSAVFPKIDGGSRKAALSGLGTTHINTGREAVNYRALPTNKYVWPPYRQPYTMFGSAVVHIGYELLDTLTYESDTPLPAHAVMGAALRDGYLYTVLGDFNRRITYPPLPASPADYGEVWTSPLYTDDQITQALVRFKLTVYRDPRNGLLRYRIRPDSHEVMWQGTLTRALSPWTFDEDVNHAVTYVLPEDAHAVYENGAQLSGFSTEHQRLQLTLDHDIGSASITASAATTAIAEDNGEVLHLEHTNGGDWQYRLGEHTIPAVEIGDIPEPVTFQAWESGEIRAKQRAIIFADLRTRTLVFVESEFVFTTQTNRDMTRRIIRWSNGEEEVLQTDEYSTANYGDGTLWALGLVEIKRLLATPISGLALYVGRISGHIYFADTDAPGITGAFALACWSPLGHPEPVTNENTSFGGCAVAAARVTPQPPAPPLVWNVLTGYGTGNNPDPTETEPPGTYYTDTGGCTVPSDPPRVCFGVHLGPNQYFPDPAGETTLSYISEGDITLLTGGVIDPPSFAISVTILGKPPKGQTVEY